MQAGGSARNACCPCVVEFGEIECGVGGSEGRHIGVKLIWRLEGSEAKQVGHKRFHL